jgi:hypothetical protein
MELSGWTLWLTARMAWSDSLHAAMGHTLKDGLQHAHTHTHVFVRRRPTLVVGSVRHAMHRRHAPWERHRSSTSWGTARAQPVCIQRHYPRQRQHTRRPPARPTASVWVWSGCRKRTCGETEREIESSCKPTPSLAGFVPKPKSRRWETRARQRVPPKDTRLTAPAPWCGRRSSTSPWAPTDWRRAWPGGPCPYGTRWRRRTQTPADRKRPPPPPVHHRDSFVPFHTPSGDSVQCGELWRRCWRSRWTAYSRFCRARVLFSSIQHWLGFSPCRTR